MTLWHLIRVGCPEASGAGGGRLSWYGRCLRQAVSGRRLKTDANYCDECRDFLVQPATTYDNVTRSSLGLFLWVLTGVVLRPPVLETFNRSLTWSTRNLGMGKMGTRFFWTKNLLFDFFFATLRGPASRHQLELVERALLGWCDRVRSFINLYGLRWPRSDLSSGRVLGHR